MRQAVTHQIASAFGFLICAAAAGGALTYATDRMDRQNQTSGPVAKIAVATPVVDKPTAPAPVAPAPVAAAILPAPSAVIADTKPAKPEKSMTAQDRIASIHQVRDNWHAADGETADQIVEAAQKAGLVTPVGWEAVYGQEGRWRVTLTWLAGRKSESWDKQSVSWNFDPDTAEAPKLQDMTAISLGRSAFMLSLLGRDDAQDQMLRHQMLSDPASLGFVRLTNGTLADALTQADCTVDDDFAFQRDPAHLGISFTPRCAKAIKGLAMFQQGADGLWQPTNRVAARLAGTDMVETAGAILPETAVVDGNAAAPAIVHSRRHRVRTWQYRPRNTWERLTGWRSGPDVGAAPAGTDHRR